MKVYEIETGSTSLDGLKMAERNKPEPSAGEVLVKVHATSLNFRDQAVVTGRYFGGTVKRNTIPLSDGAGEVEAIGAGVSRFKKGDRVAGTFFQDWIDGPPPPGPHVALGSPADGMLAEYVVLNEQGLVKIPDSLSFEEGATLPCAALTSWNALMVSSRIKPGDTVLAMGTGGVSIFALQFARVAGARVIITSSSDDKLEHARKLGADDTINYRTHTDWEQEVLKLTDGLGVDNIIEVGGVGTVGRSFQAVACNGTVSLIGVLAGPDGDTSPHPLMFKGARLQGIFVGSRRMFEDMNKAIEVNRIKPVIDKVFDFDQAAEAYKYQLSGQHFGKIVIMVSG